MWDCAEKVGKSRGEGEGSPVATAVGREEEDGGGGEATEGALEGASL